MFFRFNLFLLIFISSFMGNAQVVLYQDKSEIGFFDINNDSKSPLITNPKGKLSGYIINADSIILLIDSSSRIDSVFVKHSDKYNNIKCENNRNINKITNRASLGDSIKLFECYGSIMFCKNNKMLWRKDYKSPVRHLECDDYYKDDCVKGVTAIKIINDSLFFYVYWVGSGFFIKSRISIFNINTGKLIVHLKGFEPSLSSDRRYLLYKSLSSGNIKIFDIKTSKHLSVKFLNAFWLSAD